MLRHARFNGLLWFCMTIVALGFLGGCTSPKPSSQLTHTLELPSGAVRFDLYRPATKGAAPLVVMAHGLWRDRTRMTGWGQRLAQEGFVAVAMDMPTLADYQRNGRAINELIDALCDGAIPACQIDRRRVGVMGHSAGGLATFLAAADNPNVKIWVGLDPVDRGGLGVDAGSRVHARAVVVRTPPSQWNQNGNATSLLGSLPGGGTDTIVSEAIHIDPEWPSDWTMEIMMGRTSEERREVFVSRAVDALKDELMNGTATPSLPGVVVTDADK